VRGKFLHAAEESTRQTTVDWTRLKVNGDGGGELLLPDPFCTGSPEIDATLADLTDLLAEAPA
ncbi:MAG: Pup--protein ligase, partial [Corynebacterium variabile]